MLTAAAMALSAHAASITGSINFDGSVTLDTASVNSATKVVDWYGNGGVGLPYVGSADGSFSGVLPNSPVAFQPGWTFNNTTGIANFWSVGGFTFSLTASHIVFQGQGDLVVNGYGMITGPQGFDATAGTWRFTTQDPSTGNPDGLSTFTFSAGTSAVPEAGTTAILLGCGLMGLFVFAKFRKQATA